MWAIITFPFRMIGSLLGMVFDFVGSVLGFVFGMVGGLLGTIISLGFFIIVVIGVIAIVRWFIRGMRGV